jgi:hypothetical protein
MICVIFGIALYSIEEAVKEGWIPYFYDNQIECGPACPNCSEALLDIVQNVDMEVKRRFQGRINYSKDTFDEVSGEIALISVPLENNSSNILN